MMKSKIVTSDCFANQKFLLNCFGLLPNQDVFRKVYAISLLILLTVYLGSIYPEILKIYYVDLKKFIISLAFEIGLLTCLLCIFIAFWNRFEFLQIFEKVQLLDELSNFNNAKNEILFVKQIKDVVRKQSNLGLGWIILVLIICISMSVVISLNEEKWILPFGSGSTITNNDNLQFISQIIIIAIVSIAFYVLVIIYINVLTLMSDHCKLLQKFIALSFTNYEGEIYKELDVKVIEKKIPHWELYKVQLKHIVPYHIGIINAGHQIDTVFSLINLISFGGISICMCLIIYHTQLNLQIMEIVTDVLFLMVGYSLLIIISIYGENVATESLKIASACYELDFVGCDLRIQKSLILIIVISQRPITPTIGKVKVLGLRTMLNILQSIYSYYTILRNLMN